MKTTSHKNQSIIEAMRLWQHWVEENAASLQSASEKSNASTPADALRCFLANIELVADDFIKTSKDDKDKATQQDDVFFQKIIKTWLQGPSSNELINLVKAMLLVLENKNKSNALRQALCDYVQHANKQQLAFTALLEQCLKEAANELEIALKEGEFHAYMHQCVAEIESRYLVFVNTEVYAKDCAELIHAGLIVHREYQSLIAETGGQFNQSHNESLQTLLPALLQFFDQKVSR
jgi:hypothetical protein